jgi:hypothetical protein
MSVSDSTKSAIAFNLTQKKTHTYQGREHYNESEYSSYLVSASEIFANAINPDPEDASNTGIVKQVTLKLYNIYNPTGDYNAYEARISSIDALGLDGFTNPRLGVGFSGNQRVGFIIPEAYGEDFRPVLKDKDGTVIPSGDLSDWFIDYFAGIITHETDDTYLNLNGSDPADDGLATLECYIYIGSFVSDVLSISGSNLYLQELINGLREDLESISGASPWQRYDGGIFYSGAVSGASFTANNFYGGIYYGNGAGLTNVVDSIVRANLVSVSGALYQDIRGVESTVQGISAYLLDQISQAQGEVSSSQLAAVSGALEAQIDAKVSTDVFVAISGDLQDQINNIEGEVTEAELRAISASLGTEIDTKVSTLTFKALSGAPWVIDGNTITFTGNIVGGSFFGDGSGLTGVTGIGIQGPQGISGQSIVGPIGPQGISGQSIVGPQGADGASYVPSAIGSTSGISAYFGESENFGYLDRDQGLLFFKTTDSYGNFWSPGVPFGQGPQGESGQDADFLSVNSNIIPDTNNEYTIGSSDNVFKALYLNTIEISGANSKLLVNDTPVLMADSLIEERQLSSGIVDKINDNAFTLDVRDGIGKEDRISLINSTIPSIAESNSRYGFAVAVDGDIAVTTSPFSDSGEGSIYIAEKYNGTWESFSKFSVTDLEGTFSNVGVNVALDRGTIALGTPTSYSGEGAVFVFEKDILTEEWVQTEIPPISAGEPIGWGSAVAVYSDIIAIGSAGLNTSLGGVVVYKKSSVDGSWQFYEKIVNPSGVFGIGFGEHLDMYSNRIAIGTPGYDGAFADSGAVYVYEDNGSGYESTRIDTLNGAFFGGFGNSVAIYKNKLVVGESALDQAYLFTFNGTSWGGQLLENELVNNGDNFGKSVAIHEDKI